MTFIILFEDDPDADPNIRRDLMAAHLAFLKAHANRIRAAGPLTEATGTAAGGLWIVDTDTADQAAALVTADPFWPTGLRKSHRILAWNEVFRDGRHLNS